MLFSRNITVTMTTLWRLVLVMIMMCYAEMSFGQSSEIYDRVENLARRVENSPFQPPFDLKNIDTNTPLYKYKYYYFESLLSNNESLSRDILNQYKVALTQTTPSSSETVILAFLEEFHSAYDFDDIVNALSTVKDTLLKYSNNEHWEVSFFSRRLLSSFQMRKRQRILALETAESAQSVIPTSLDVEAVMARVSISEFLAYLHNVQANVNLAVSASERYLDLSEEANMSVDGIELLANLMYSLSIQGEHEANLIVAETLLRLTEKHTPSTPGITEISVAKAYLGVHDYERAEAIARVGVSKATLTGVRNAAMFVVAASLAGQGRTDESKFILENELPEDAKTSRHWLKAQTIIAFKEGRIDEGLKLMEQRIDRTSRSILNITSNDASSIMASLENSRERQAEREEALKREAVLVQSRLKQQEKINTLLIALVGFAFLVVIASMVFVRRLQKMARSLSLKSEEAQSADRMKTEFLGMVSHELRTPLNGIIGLADVMAQTGPTEQVKERAGIILSSGNELFNVIESVIDMSRIEGNKLELVTEPCSVHDILFNTCTKWDKAAREKGLKFSYFVAETAKTRVDIDPLRTQQCIDTLICNAIKFTDEGRVHVHVTSDVLTEEKAQIFTVIVADTGQGMSHDVQSKLFQPFRQADNYMTRKHGGSGLRLAIARAMARMMHGNITVNSRENRGSEFTLTFKATISHKALQSSPITASGALPETTMTITPEASSHELIQLKVSNPVSEENQNAPTSSGREPNSAHSSQLLPETGFKKRSL